MNPRRLLLLFVVLFVLPVCNRRQHTVGTGLLPQQVDACVKGGCRVLLNPLASQSLLGTVRLRNGLHADMVGADTRFRFELPEGYWADETEVVLGAGEQRSIAVYTSLVTLAALQITVFAELVSGGLTPRTFPIRWTNEAADSRALALIQRITAAQLIGLWYASALTAPIGVLTWNSNLLIIRTLAALAQDIRLYGALAFSLSLFELNNAFGTGLAEGAPVFPLGQGPEGFTLAAEPAAPLTAGDYCVFWLATREAIPLADPVQLLQYAFVFDSDANPANNWVPAPAFQGDYFKDTDRWYELNYAPSTGWALRCRVVGAGNTLTTVPSGARAIFSGDTLLLLVPRSEFAVPSPPFRATTFAHLGDFGQNDPFVYSGDPTPAVAEGLRFWQ